MIDGAPGGFMRSPRRVYGEKVGGVQPGVVVVQGSIGGCQRGAHRVEVAVGREEKKIVHLEKMGGVFRSTGNGQWRTYCQFYGSQLLSMWIRYFRSIRIRIHSFYDQNLKHFTAEKIAN